MNKSAVGKVKLSYQHACIECRTLAEGTYPLGMCRLHASAPEMLEMLIAVADDLRSGRLKHEDNVLPELKALIAKAEGRV